MKTVNGTIEFEGSEYDYRAELATNDGEGWPDHIIDLDCADGTSLPDHVNFEALGDIALENARLLDWCERNQWFVEDTGGSCCSFTRSTKRGCLRITRYDDPSCPQTFAEPIALGRYDADGNAIGPVKIFQGGIDQYLKER